MRMAARRWFAAAVFAAVSPELLQKARGTSARHAIAPMHGFHAETADMKLNCSMWCHAKRV
jgi:hypothetical protein